MRRLNLRLLLKSGGYLILSLAVVPLFSSAWIPSTHSARTNHHLSTNHHHHFHSYGGGGSSSSSSSSSGSSRSSIQSQRDDDNASMPQMTTTTRTTRRSFVSSASAIFWGAWSYPVLLIPSFPEAATAALTSTTTDADFAVGKLSVDEARTRFQAARKEATYLIDHYEEISRGGGGDAVRNYLGTQGKTSSLFGIQKVLTILREESEDLVEYTETMDEFNAYYYQAEGAAYQSMFAEHSSAKATPESLLATAKKDLLQMTKYMDQLAGQLNL